MKPSSMSGEVRFSYADIYAVYPLQLQIATRAKAFVDTLIETLGAS